jgi:hypothetical protein
MRHWTESDVYQALETVFPSPAHVLLAQVRNGTGFAAKTRTADALALSVYPSRGLWLAGIEIKVTRSDWRREKADPDKAESMAKYCRYWYVAAPAGVVPADDLPETWGLIECARTGKALSAQVARKPDKMDPAPLTMPVICSILRNQAAATVPAHQLRQVQDTIHEQATQIADAKCASLEQQIAEERRTRIEFEKLAGVQINCWNHGHIARAVKQVLAVEQVDVITANLRRAIADARRAIDNIAERLEDREEGNR